MNLDVFFAYGIRLTLKSLGLRLDDANAIQPILEQMDAILDSPKNSLISGRGVTDWDNFRHLREIECQLCVEYLKKVIDIMDQ